MHVIIHVMDRDEDIFGNDTYTLVDTYEFDYTTPAEWVREELVLEGLRPLPYQTSRYVY